METPIVSSMLSRPLSDAEKFYWENFYWGAGMDDKRNTPQPGWKSDEMHWGHWLLLTIYLGPSLFFTGWWLVEVVGGF